MVSLLDTGTVFDVFLFPFLLLTDAWVCTGAKVGGGGGGGVEDSTDAEGTNVTAVLSPGITGGTSGTGGSEGFEPGGGIEGELDVDALAGQELPVVEAFAGAVVDDELGAGKELTTGVILEQLRV